MTGDFVIVSARPEDAEELLSIYAPYVRETAITFEYDVPACAEFEERIRSTLRRYPYLVMRDASGAALGYAYASPFHDRPAYSWSVETSIYIRQDARGRGLGKVLLLRLESELAARGILNACACIAYARPENTKLTNASAAFHEKMGYRLVGRFDRCGYKFSQWYDMIWMEKILGEHTIPPVGVSPQHPDQRE